MLLNIILFLYVFTSFFTIYISTKYSIPLWKIFILSIVPFLLLLPFTTYPIFASYPIPIEWIKDKLYAQLINEIIPLYQALYVPLTLASVSVFYIHKKYSLSYIKIILTTLIIFSILCFSYIAIISAQINTHSVHINSLINLFFLNIFYYLYILILLKKIQRY